jgi:hypothetical protein
MRGITGEVGKRWKYQNMPWVLSRFEDLSLGFAHAFNVPYADLINLYLLYVVSMVWKRCLGITLYACLTRGIKTGL